MALAALINLTLERTERRARAMHSTLRLSWVLAPYYSLGHREVEATMPVRPGGLIISVHPILVPGNDIR
jgi:hypothetical protein